MNLCCCNDIYGMLANIDCQCCGGLRWCTSEYCKTSTETKEAELVREQEQDPGQLQLPFPEPNPTLVLLEYEMRQGMTRILEETLILPPLRKPSGQ